MFTTILYELNNQNNYQRLIALLICVRVKVRLHVIINGICVLSKYLKINVIMTYVFYL